MFKVQKLNRETVIKQIATNNGTVGTKTGNHISWAVITESGDFARNTNGQPEIYSQKRAAQQVAEWYNKK